ncbi:Procollagen galactosyltransferase 1-B [Neolecta irregularis DAH-3]|uniref:Procollagen galactosyltransferase 1-B n=1 Tax=Neolecta irregularis (strain DAH-3) TaxID=1198029 RepID=A0A1U7LKT2_NEOID|nr:Procollagen galactosyltransferase 1-B [Neolecta irregularis DAH-3]|eukprot:OLL23203.1 Procollagen galactosyltransferase 1-B [Neolecta irregularis DAH-3]
MYSMISKRFLVLILAISLCIVTIITTKRVSETSKVVSTFTSNRTLGFGEIYVISLPHRTDRQDAMVLMALNTGFDIKFIDGVYGKTVPDEIIPGNTRDGLGGAPGVVGCWRSHMNALKMFLQTGKEA